MVCDCQFSFDFGAIIVVATKGVVVVGVTGVIVTIIAA